MSGRFAFGTTENGIEPVLLSQEQKFKINTLWGAGSQEIIGFEIIDTSGYKYVFGYINATEESSSTAKVIVYPKFGNLQFPNPVPATVTNSAWHLIAIRDQNDTELVKLVTFSYKNSVESYIIDTRTENRLLNLNNDQLANPYNRGLFRPQKIIGENTVVTQTKKLESISFKDGTSIIFNTTLDNTHPENNGVYLTRVSSKDSEGNTVKSFSFDYETTSAGRLWLKKVMEGDLTSSDYSYDLSCFDKESLPSVYGDYDEWGYKYADHRREMYNGQLNFYDFDAIKSGVLTEIKLLQEVLRSLILNLIHIRMKGMLR